ncbi:MAG: FliG C-terminal domain-containing protein [Planctomycetaceae bacterium]
MNPWLNFTTQVQQRWGQLSTRQRAAYGGILGVGLLAGGWYFTSQPATPPGVPLWGGKALPAAEVRTAQAKLKEAGIANVRVVQGQVLVPADQLAHSESVLQALAPVTEANSSRFEKALGQAAWSVSESHRQELLDSARASDLVALFKNDPHIADARLMWNRSRKRSFHGDTRMTVVLNITPRPGKRIPPALAESLKTAVVNTFGLAGPQDVSLIEFGPDGAQLVRHADTPAPGDATPPRPLSPREDEVELVDQSVTRPSRPQTYAPELPAGREAARLATAAQRTQPIGEEPNAPARRAPGSAAPRPSRTPATPRDSLQERLQQQLGWIPQVKVDVTDRPGADGNSTDLPGAGNSLPSAQTGRPPQVTVIIPSVVTRSLLQPGERPGGAEGVTGKSRRSRIDVRRKVEQLVRKELQLGPRVPAREFVTVTFQEDEVAGDDVWSNQITCYLTAIDWRRAWPWGAGTVSGLAGVTLLALRRRRKQAAVASPDTTVSSESSASEAASGSPAATSRSAQPGKAHNGERAEGETPVAAKPRNRSVSAAAATGTVGDTGDDEAAAAVRAVPGESHQSELARTVRRRSRHERDADEEQATGFDLESIRPPRGTGGLSGGARGSGADSPAPPAASFTQLHDCSAEEWHELLEEEQPQTIAVILSQLPPAQSSFVLRMMPAANRLDVVRRMTALEQPAPAVLQQLATTLATRLRQVRQVRATHPLGTAGSGMAGMGTSGVAPHSQAAAPFLVPLAAHSTPPVPQLRHLARHMSPPPPAERPGGSQPIDRRPQQAGGERFDVRSGSSALPYRPTPAVPGPTGGAVPESTFADLAMLDDNSLRELFAQFDVEHWAVALRGAEVSLVAKLTHALTAGDAQGLTAAGSQLGPVRLGDVDAAQRAIAQRLAPLRYRGRRPGGPAGHSAPPREDLT